MPLTSSRSLPLPLLMSELAVAVPQVMAHRITRMALAGAFPSARDQKEFRLMGSEKIAALQEGWVAMVWQVFRVQQQMALSLMLSTASPWALWQQPSFGSLGSQWARAGQGVLSHGLRPMHRRAVANSKRLRTVSLV